MRMAVDQEASIPRVEGTAQKYTIQSFLQHVAMWVQRVLLIEPLADVFEVVGLLPHRLKSLMQTPLQSSLPMLTFPHKIIQDQIR